MTSTSVVTRSDQIDPDGDVYKDGSKIGEIESGGDLYASGSAVGQIESDGDIYINGSKFGQIESDGDIYKGGSRWGEANGCCPTPEAARWVFTVLYFFGSGFF